MNRLELLAICERCGEKKSPPRDRMTGLCCQCDADSTCRHYQDRPFGILPDDWTCPAGMQPLRMAAPVHGSMTRIPCRWLRTEMIVGTQAICPRFEASDLEDELAWDRAVEDSDRKMRLVLPVVAKVKAEHKGQGWAGAVPCPTGCGGVLHLSHAAYNGHCWGKCSTDGCVSWME